MNHAQASAIVESLHDWPAWLLLDIYQRVSDLEWSRKAIRAEADLREVIARVGTDDGSDDHNTDPVLDLDDTLFTAYWALLEHFGERCADESADLSRDWIEHAVRDGWYAGGGRILERLEQLKRMEICSRTVAIGPRSDHVREGPAVRCSGVTFSPSPGPWLDISRLDLLEHQRTRLSDEQAQPSDAARRERDRLEARARVERLIDAYHALFELLTTPEMLERFVRQRVRVTIGEQESAPYERSGVSFWSRAMDIEDARVERAFEQARELAQEFAPVLRERLYGVPVSTLVQVRGWWDTPNPLTELCPGPLQTACQPLGEAIARRVIHACLVADSRPLQGGHTRAGDPAAHILVEAIRWPSKANFPGALEARRALIEAASWGDYTWGASGLGTDKSALEGLQARLKGEPAHAPKRR